MRHRHQTSPVADLNPAWSRRKLTALGLTVITGGLLVVLGLVLTIIRTITAAPLSPPGGPASASPLSVRDAAAASPMPRTTAPAITVPLRLPEPAELHGPGGVPAGFPHTPEGAIAQLAAIDQSVLSTMRPQLACDVYTAWALPGGVGPDAWILTRNAESFTNGLAQAARTGTTAQLTATPKAGLVKATDGPDWAVVCVLLDIRATVRVEARLNYGHCERMQYADGRWQIAAGTPPVPPDAVAPDSPAAIAAGWRPLTTT